MVDSFQYSDETLEHSREIYRMLSKRVSNKLYTPVSYGQVADAIGTHPRALRFPLAKIQDECRSKDWPTITVLIVDQDTGLPNSGCDAFGERNVREARAAVATVPWPDAPWW